MKIYEAWDELKQWLFILQDDLIPADSVRAKMEDLEYKYELLAKKGSSINKLTYHSLPVLLTVRRGSSP